MRRLAYFFDGYTPNMLYGRDAELAQIDRLLARARTGQSGSLSVCGEVGVGKSAILDHAVLVADGMRVLRGTCIESEAELPFAGLHLLLRPVLDRLDVLPGPQADALRGAFGLADVPRTDRFLTGLATLTLLTELADGEPTVCTVDDAHWLDQASATALLFAARRLDAEGIALIFGARDGGLVCGSAGIQVLRPGALDHEASARLLAEVAADLARPVRDRIIEQSGGNPLALIELPAALTAEQRAGRMHPQTFHIGTLPVSSRVQDIFQNRIEALPERTRLLLLVAAADDTEDLGIVLTAAGLLRTSIGDLAPAEQARLVQTGDGTLRFRHPLIRAAAYQSAASSHRIAAHRALAEALGAAGQPDRQAWQLAAAATGPDEAVAAGLERAAEYARRRGGYAAEAAAYERAALLSPDRPQKGRRLALAAAATGAAGQLRQAGALAERAGYLVDDAQVLAALAEVQAAVEFEIGSSGRAAASLLAGAAGVAAVAPDLAAKMLVEAAHEAIYGSAVQTARRAARDLAQMDASPPYAAFVPAVAGLASIMADELSAGVREIRQTLSDLRQLNAADPLASLPPGLRRLAAVCALTVGDDQGAHDHAATLAEECRRQGMISLLPHALQLLAAAQQFLGLHADARASGMEGLRIACDTGQEHRAAHLSGVLGRIAAIEGDETACRALAEQAATWRSAPAVNSADHSLSLLDLGAGRPDAALARLTDLTARPGRHTLIAIFSLPDLVEAAAASQRPELGGPALARFEAFSLAAGQPWAAAVVMRCRALLGQDTAVSFEEAVRMHSDGGRPFERARTELFYGSWLRRNRRRADARGQLESALDIFSRLGAAPWAARARSELRATGVSQHGTATPPDDGDLIGRLTPQELQVVRHAAAGLSNREIGALLFLSPRTVGYHLYKAYPKLAVTTRAQLARLVLPVM